MPADSPAVVHHAFSVPARVGRVFLARFALLLGLAMAFPSARATDRAVWTWERESYAMISSPVAADDALRFLRGKRVTTIYLYADAYRGRNLIATAAGVVPALHPARTRRRLQGLCAARLGLSAHRGYVLPQRRAVALAMMQRVLSYNAALQPDARFDGVNLDIEPHMLAQWKTQKMELLRQYLDLSHAFMALKRDSGQTLVHRTGHSVLARWHRHGMERRHASGKRAHDRSLRLRRR